MRHKEKKIILKSRQQTFKLGEELGKTLPQGSVVLLIGDLGAGKTVFTQGLAKGLGVKEQVTSPTFVLMQPYQGRIPLYHLDLYRLDNVRQVEGIGLDEYLFGEGVCVIEWAEKIKEAWPKDYLKIEFTHISEKKRRIVFKPKGQALKIISPACLG